jgi:hypothetical protein
VFQLLEEVLNDFYASFVRFCGESRVLYFSLGQQPTANSQQPTANSQQPTALILKSQTQS